MYNEFVSRMNSVFESIAMHVVKLRWFYLIIIGLLSCAAIYSTLHIQLDNSLEAYFMEDDEEFKYYESFKDMFGSDKFIYIVYDNPFIASNMNIVRELGYELQANLSKTRGKGKKLYLKKITMLPTVEFVEGKDDELLVYDLLEDWDGSQGALDVIYDKVLSKEIYKDALVSRDGKKGGLLIELNEIDDELNWDDSVYKLFKEVIDKEKYHDLNLIPVGDTVLNATYNEISWFETSKFSIITVLVTLSFLWLLFRRFSGIVAPYLAANLAILFACGLMPLLNIKFTMMMPILPSLLMVVGIGGSIHIITEFIFLFNSGMNRNQAIFESYRLVGFPCFLAAFTTAVGLGSIMISQLRAVREFAIMASIGVFLTFVMILLFVPLILCFGRKTIKEKKMHDDPSKKDVIGHFLGVLGRFNENKSGLILLVALVIIGLSFWGMTKIHVDALWLDEFGDSVKTKQDYYYVDRTMGGTGSIDLVIDTRRDNGAKYPQILKAVWDIQEYAQKSDIVMKTFSMVDLVCDVNRSIHNEDPAYFKIPDTQSGIAQLLLLYEDSGGEELDDMVDFSYQKLRLNIRIKTVKSTIWKEFSRDISDYAENRLNGLADVKVTGISYLTGKALEYISRTQIQGFLLAFIIITVMFIFVFQSFKQGVLLMIPNLLPIIITLGIMGHAGIELDYVTLLLACIAIGIAVDDTIHFATRFRLEFERRKNYKKAMHQTLQSTGRAMLSTSIILISGFLVMIFSVMDSFVHFGILTSFTIFLALVADYFVAPAMIIKLKLFGPEN